MTIPEELRSLPQWVCWGAPGYNRKCPINPRTGYPAKAGSPDTWATLPEACQAARARGYEGIGFEFAEGGGIVGIDFDHCIQNSQLSPWAAAWVNRFDSYTEVSPSGEGLHIFCQGTLPGPGIKRPRAEIYDRARYFTFTGSPCGPAKPVRAAQEAINALYAELQADARKEQPAQPAPQPPAPALPADRNHLSTGLERDAMLSRLWRGERPNGNESADDMALMNKLAYWCSCDPGTMKSAFLSSPHFQTKDEAHKKKAALRADYLPRTITAAIQSCARTAADDNAAYHSRTGMPPNRASPVQEAQHAKNVIKTTQSEFAPFEPFEEETVNLPAFPVEELPPIMRDYAKAIAESVQVPIDIPAIALLGVAALAAQGTFTITAKPGWEEPLNLYCVIVAKPSERKSPVLKEVMRCIYRFMAEENERRAPQIREYQTKKRILEKRLTALTEQASKPTKSPGEKEHVENLLKEQAVLDVQKEIDELTPVRPLRLLADDVTIEALTSLLAENNGRMGIASAEGGIFNVLAGLYSGGREANIDAFLKAYMAEQIMVDRKGRPSEIIETPALTLLLMVQPQVLHKVMENSEFRGRGLLARFLYSIPHSVIGTRKYETPAVPEPVYEAFRTHIAPLLQMQAEGTRGGTISLTEDAAALSRDFHYQLEPRLPDELEDVGDWAGKFHGQILRTAGVLHCMETGPDAATEPLRAQTMQSAITIGNYFLEHAKAAFRPMGTNEKPEVKDAKYILKRLSGTGKTEISKRNLYDLCKGRLQTVEAFEPGLTELSRRGYIRISKTTTGARGRPSETIFLRTEN